MIYSRLDILDYSMNFQLGKSIDNLPTLSELVEILVRLQEATPVLHLSPFNAVVRDNNKYIITRLVSGRYSIKPNISQKSFLYRGENQFYKSAVPTEFRHGNNDAVLLANIRANDFVAMMQSHPLYRMLSNGIRLSDRETVRVENPYGMASCYGLETLNLSLTSDLWAAAFYAVSDYDSETNSYKQVIPTERDETKIGAIYAFFLAMPFPTIYGLSAVGFIPFPHLENQRTFVFQMSNGMVFERHPLQKKFYFRHDAEIDKLFFNSFHQGADLTLPDEILSKAKLLMTTKQVSKAAFKKNLSDNPRDKEDVNMRRMEGMGFQISDIDFSFTDQELATYRQRISLGYWQSFCDQLDFSELRSKNAREIFCDLPNNPNYQRFFI